MIFQPQLRHGCFDDGIALSNILPSVGLARDKRVGANDASKIAFVLDLLRSSRARARIFIKRTYDAFSNIIVYGMTYAKNIKLIPFSHVHLTYNETEYGNAGQIYMHVLQ